MGEPQTVKIGHEREFLLLSDLDERSLVMRGRDGELYSFNAHLSLPRLRADALVPLAPPAIESPVADFFDDLAVHWRGWDSVKEWRAYEGGLAFLATNDGRGHITLSTELRERSSFGWLVRGDVPLDAGQLDQVARDVRRFVGR